MQILVTGAAGLIGGELTARLAAAGHGVLALVHRTHALFANDGSAIAATAFAGALPAPGAVVTVAGDVRQPGLGLSAAVQAQIAGALDMLIHCAAITAFDADKADYDAINVGGTRHALGFAPDAHFLHVSTAYVCGEVSGPVPECPRDPAPRFANGYERSKAEAEALVMASPGGWTIARPSIVVGDSRTGVIRGFDTIYKCFKLLAEGRMSQMPATADATLDFVPIDHVVGGILDIVANLERCHGGIFHLSSANPLPAMDLIAAIDRHPGLARPHVVAPDAFAPERLTPLERRLYARSLIHYAGYFQRSPQFATDALERLSQRQCPPVDAAMVDRMITYCVEQGFISTTRAA